MSVVWRERDFSTVPQLRDKKADERGRRRTDNKDGSKGEHSGGPPG